MSPKISWFVRHACFLAGLAYAARMKRLGHWYYVGVVAAVFDGSDESQVVFGGSMPRAVTAARERSERMSSRDTLASSRRDPLPTAIDSE